MEGGRWGLVIVASAFFIQVFAFGVSTSIGVYNIAFLDYFDHDTVGVSLISALNWAVFLGSGPLCSYLMTKTTFRKIALLGSVMTVLGIFLMPFLPYIPAFCVCFGVLSGLGSCFVYVPSHVLSGLYYDRHQSLSTGVATSGSGLGGAIMPIIIGKLIDHYGWQGSLIIVAGMELHLIVFSALLRAPPASLNKKPKDPPALLELNSLDKREDLDTNISTQQEEIPRASLATHEETEELVVENGAEQVGVTSHSKAADVNGACPALESENVAFIANRESAEAAQTDPDPNTGPGEKRKASASVRRRKGTTEHLPNIRLFTDVGFDVYFVSSILWNASAASFLAFGPDKMAETGISALNSAWLLTIFGLGNFSGGILGAVIGNIWVDHRIAQYVGANIFMGACLFAFPFGSAFAEFAVILILAGLSFGVILGLLVVVLIDLIGTENLNDGLGYVLLANGIGAFSGPAVTGVIREAYGSYDFAFYIAGAIGMLAGAIMWLIPVIYRHFLQTNTSRTQTTEYVV